MAEQLAKFNSAIQKSYKDLSINVHKFGGSSLATAEQIQNVADIVKTQTKVNDIIVVSANGKVTDWLLLAGQGQEQYITKISSYLNQLLQQLNLVDSLKAIFTTDIQNITKGLKEQERNLDSLLAYGEVWSAKILAELLQSQGLEADFVHAAQFLKLSSIDDYQPFELDFAERSFSELYTNIDQKRYIFTGFIAQNQRGEIATLGRNGSDYSATTIAGLTHAKSVTIWTDVDGIFSADPNIIVDAKQLESISLCEAQALSELGANVLHQKTINPLLSNNTEACIRSSFQQNSVGTRIKKQVDNEQVVKTITIKNQLNRIIIDNITEIGAREVQQKILANQIATYASNFDRSLDRLSLYTAKTDLFNVVSIIKATQYLPLIDQKNYSLLSLVGQNLRLNRAVVSKFLNRIEKFDVDQIYYPSNSHTLCIFVDESNAKVILQDLHSTFFALEPSIPVVVLGYGNIGKQFIKILRDNKSEIEKSINQSLSLIAIANSKHYALDEKCLTRHGDNYFVDLKDNSNNQLLEVLAEYKNKELVVVDLTANNEIAQRYLEFADNSWHIISANKIAASNHRLANNIDKKLSTHKRFWLKNTTAGAGLPVQSTLSKLKESGDSIQEISGIFSGSLSWIFSQFDGTKPFVELLKIAKDNAFTEPDPREDLSGNDVIRKIKILARESGFSDAKENFDSAIDASLLDGTLDDFWSKEKKINEYYQQLFETAQKQNGLLRYIATINKEELKLQLEIIDKNHAFANLNPCDNIFSIKTAWYQDNPLIIQGPGAGREVTAAGVLNDLCDLLRKVK